MQETLKGSKLCGRGSCAGSTQASADAADRRSQRKRKGSPGSQSGCVAGESWVEVNPRPRMTREITLEIAAKEYVWLWDRRHGIGVETIAAREGVSAGRVRYGVARARAQEGATVSPSSVRPPRLVPLFPVGPYTPRSNCAHKRPIEPGSSLCCMVCHISGMDGHPALKRDRRTDPTPESKPKPSPAQAKLQRETRKKRRKRLFGARA